LGELYAPVVFPLKQLMSWVNKASSERDDELGELYAPVMHPLKEMMS